MPALCNLNGELLPEAGARISVLDRGFLFGDSVYEVMRTRAGVPFAWPEHLERLQASADGIALNIGATELELLRRIKATLLAAAVGEAYLRVVVTRGVGTAPNIDLSYAPGPPTVLIMVRPLAPAAALEARLAVIPRLRTDRRALDPGIKSGNYLNNLLGLAEAKARGATDCLFLNLHGCVTECSTSNFYLVRDGVVLTPPLDAGLLSGVTRRLLIELCASTDVVIREQDLDRADLDRADEMFLSSTLRDIVPVVAVDDAPVGDGKPGPLTRRLRALFAEFAAQRTREVYEPPFAALEV